MRSNDSERFRSELSITALFAVRVSVRLAGVIILRALGVALIAVLFDWCSSSWLPPWQRGTSTPHCVQLTSDRVFEQ